MFFLSLKIWMKFHLALKQEKSTFNLQWPWKVYPIYVKQNPPSIIEWTCLTDTCTLYLSYYRMPPSATYSKTCVKRPPSKWPKIGFQDQLSLHAGQKYCRMLQAEHSAIFSTFIKLPFVIKTFILSIFEWPLDRKLYSVNINLPYAATHYWQNKDL